MNILVTGFDPFGDDTVNPASLILDGLPDSVGEHNLTKLQIPTSAKRSEKALQTALDKDIYDAVISIGQAAGRSDITLERVAINLDEFRIADNDGEVLSGTKIKSDGPDGYLVKLPLKAMVGNIQKREIPASVSYTAGTFVCNHVLYLANFLLQKHSKAGKATFIHVPYLPSQTALKPKYPSMSLDLMIEAVVAAIEAIDHVDISDATEGTIC